MRLDSEICKTSLPESSKQQLPRLTMKQLYAALFVVCCLLLPQKTYQQEPPWVCNNTEGGWTPVRFDDKTGVCLKAFGAPATWEEAQKTCRQHRGFLFSLNDPDNSRVINPTARELIRETIPAKLPATADLISIPEDRMYYVAVGEGVLLTCNVTGSLPISVDWVHTSEQGEIRNIENGLTGEFKINSPDAQGMYQCRARNDYGVAVSPPVRVALAELKQAGSDLSENTYNLQEGSSFKSLSLFILQIPKADLVWSHDGKNIEQTQRRQVGPDDILYISYVKLEDKGAYQAAYYSDILRMTVVVMDFIISVTANSSYLRENPPIRLEYKSSGPDGGAVMGLMGDTLELRCIFSGYPLPEITWSPGRSESRSISTDQNNGTFSLTNIQQSAEGIYKCFAATLSGTIEATISVNINSRPTFRQPLLQNVVAEELDDVTFTCEVDAMPPADITWFINGQYLSPENERGIQIFQDNRLYIARCGSQHIMNIQCNASNIWGAIYAQATLSVLGMRPFWLGLHTYHKRFRWDSPVFDPFIPQQYSSWIWDEGQPAVNKGTCGYVSGSQRIEPQLLRKREVYDDIDVKRNKRQSDDYSLFLLGLNTCSTKLAYICWNEGIVLDLKTGGLCEGGWYGHPLYPHCYKTSPQRLSYDKAKATCEGEESILVTPSDYMQKMAFQQALSIHQTAVSCYSCFNALSENTCQYQEVCQPNEMCFLDVFFNADNQRRNIINKGCRHEDICESRTSLNEVYCQSEILGEITGDKIAKINCSYCCENDACNVARNRDELGPYLYQALYGESNPGEDPDSAAEGRGYSSSLAPEDTYGYWIGLRGNGYGFTWEDGRPLEGKPYESGLTGCAFHDSQREDLQWDVVDCGKQHWFVCQKPRSTPDHVEITKQPADVDVPLIWEIFENRYYNLSCNASSYDPTRRITWLMNGVSMQSEAAPGGFTYFPRPEGEEQSVGVDATYQCMVWGVEPGVPLLSQPARYIEKGVLELRFTANASRKDFKKGFHDLINYGLPPSSQEEEDLAMTIRNLPRFNRGDCRLRFDNYRSGSLLVDFSLTYKFPAALHSPEVALRVAFNVTPQQNENAQLLLEEQLIHELSGSIDTYLVDSTGSSGSDQYTSMGLYPGNVVFRSKVACFSTTTESLTGSLTWDITRVGQTASSAEVCLSDGKPLATRRCLGDQSFGAYWHDDIIYRSEVCPQPPQSEVTVALKELAQVPVNAGNSDDVSNKLNDLTANSSVLVYTDIIYASEVMEHLTSQQESITRQTGNNLIKTANQLLDTQGDVLAESQITNKASTRIVLAIERLSDNVVIGKENMTEFKESAIVLQVWRFTSKEDMIRGFGSGMADSLYPSTENYAGWSEVDVNDTDAAILVSEEVLQKVQDYKDALKSAARSADIKGEVRVTFTLYTSSHFFLTPDQLQSSYAENQDSETRYVNSTVIAATVNGLKLWNLTDPVNMIFHVKAITEHHTCAYWDYFANNGRGDWSDYGCTTNITGPNHLACHCNHLTNFAILFDYDQGKSISEKHETALSIISTIGLVISIVALTFTIITFFVIKKFRKELKGRVLFNLVIAILCTDVVFLAGIENAVDSSAGCRAVAALLHYFLLASFAWMLTEGVLHYLKLVKVIGSHVERFLLKACICSWGGPLIPVVVILAVDNNLYRGPHNYCWMDLTPFYYGFLVPIGLVIIINTLIYILIIRSITCSRPKGMQSTQSKAAARRIQVQASICIFVLLGMTWVFGFFAIEGARLVFQYLFCIFNSVQGLFIFLFHVLRDKGVREAWCNICRCRKEKTPQKKARKQIPASSGTGTDDSLLKTPETERRNRTAGLELHQRQPTSTTDSSALGP